MRLLKVGFEIEGGWDGEQGISPFTDISLIHDNSINGQTLKTAAIHATHVGEAVSPPINIGDMITSVDRSIPQWQAWLESHWPNAAPPNRTNHTCGFHIHLSMGSLRDYALLSSKYFLFALKDRMLEVGKEVKLPSKHNFWQRMEGKNTFATLLYDPARQMEIHNKEEINRQRYGWLNFSYHLHGTMEFRALPTFRDASVAVKFTQAYIDFVEKWLESQKDVVLERKESF